jgi:hypothetical protein
VEVAVEPGTKKREPKRRKPRRMENFFQTIVPRPK